MKEFTRSLGCATRKLCAKCRDGGPVGDQFRKGIARAFTIPLQLFPCPHGVTGSGAELPLPTLRPLPVPSVPPLVVVERLRHCARCEDNVGGQCQPTAAKYPGRASVAMGVRRKNSRCPRGLWPALSVVPPSQGPRDDIPSQSDDR